MRLAKWGQSTTIDIKKCDKTILKSRANIQEFVIQFCKQFDLERVQDISLHDFDEEGIAMYQLCQQEILTGIFSYETGLVILQILHKTTIPYQDATEFTAEFFKGSKLTALAEISRRGEAYGGDES